MPDTCSTDTIKLRFYGRKQLPDGLGWLLYVKHWFISIFSLYTHVYFTTGGVAMSVDRTGNVHLVPESLERSVMPMSITIELKCKDKVDIIGLLDDVRQYKPRVMLNYLTCGMYTNQSSDCVSITKKALFAAGYEDVPFNITTPDQLKSYVEDIICPSQ